MNREFFSNIKVLVVDDDEDDFLILKRLFSKIADSPFELEWIGEYDAAIEAIAQKRHDIYLIDYRLGAYTGLDVLRQVNAVERVEPFILLTGVGDSEIELESLRLAASDYLIKSNLDSSILSRTMYYALGRKEIERNKIDQLVELNRSKDEFISIASHQLRTPATAVKQYLGMVTEGFAGELSEKQTALLNKAYQNNERQLTIINDLLKVAQIDAGSTGLTIEPTDVGELIELSIDDVHVMIKERKQTITTTVPDIAFALIDTELIRMVLNNLLDNASKYTDEGGKIHVKVSKDDEFWLVEIIDNGVGVNDPRRLFQKFSRIDNPLSTKVGGSGLGLYWAKSVAELHLGTITYRPNKDGGSIFGLTIPRVL